MHFLFRWFCHYCFCCSSEFVAEFLFNSLNLRFWKVSGVPRYQKVDFGSLKTDVIESRRLSVPSYSRILTSVSKSSKYAFQRDEPSVRTTKSGRSVDGRATDSQTRISISRQSARESNGVSLIILHQLMQEYVDLMYTSLKMEESVTLL
jgi:hypothetical protein